MIKFVDSSKIKGGVTTEKFSNLLLDQRSILQQVECNKKKMTSTSFVSGEIFITIHITRALEMKFDLLLYLHQREIRFSNKPSYHPFSMTTLSDEPS